MEGYPARNTGISLCNKSKILLLLEAALYSYAGTSPENNISCRRVAKSKNFVIEA